VTILSFEGKSPQIHPSAWIAPTATIVGDVRIDKDASVWYGAVVRGDFSPVVIGAGSNIQECSVVHAPPNLPVAIGAGVTVGHLCMIHGAVIGDDCLIGNGTTILDGARIGPGSFIAAHSLVGKEIPPGVMAAGSPAVVKKEIAGTPMGEAPKGNALLYADLARRHRSGAKEI
jgi:carbonic anhydrase/acetyltransferase-like protein (isoleucine patch superfamily)